MIQFYLPTKNRKTISQWTCFPVALKYFFLIEVWNTTPMNGFVICRRKTYATTESNDVDIFSAYHFYLQEEGFIS